MSRSILVGFRLDAGCLRRIEHRLGLPELGPQVRVVQAHQHVACLDDLTGLQIDLNDACQELRADPGFMHGPDGPNGRLDQWQPNQAHLRNDAECLVLARGDAFCLHRYLRRELASQP